jgi:hypothetical protein
MGKLEQNIAKQAVQAGKEIPDKIKNAPSLEIGLDLYLSAFFDLESDRQIGFGIGPISWSVVNEYAKAYHLDEIQCEKLHRYIKMMDSVYLKHHNRETK